MKWQKWRKIVFIALVVLVVGLIIAFQFSEYNINPEDIRQYLKKFGIWAPSIFIALYTLGVIFLPATPFIVAAGILFGIKYGFIYTIIGSVLSSVILFNISRRLGKEWVENILEKKYFVRLNQYNQKLANNAVWDLVILRIIPFVPLNVLNILMGVSRIKTEDYVIGTILGLIPSNIVIVYFGNLLIKMF